MQPRYQKLHNKAQENRRMHLNSLASQKDASRAKESFICMQLIMPKLLKIVFSAARRYQSY
jgi:hypothetical protein